MRLEPLSLFIHKRHKFKCVTRNGSYDLDGVICGPAYAYSCKLHDGVCYDVRNIAIKSTVGGSVKINVLMTT